MWYRSEADLDAAFEAFARRVALGGTLLVCGDDAGCQRLVKTLTRDDPRSAQDGAQDAQSYSEQVSISLIIFVSTCSFHLILCCSSMRPSTGLPPNPCSSTCTHLSPVTDSVSCSSVRFWVHHATTVSPSSWFAVPSVRHRLHGLHLREEE